MDRAARDLINLMQANPDLAAEFANRTEADRAALEYARSLRARKVPPAVRYRCRQGCTLVAAWPSPAGVVAWFPAARVSKGQAAALTGILAGTWVAENSDDQAVRLGERGALLPHDDPAAGIGVCCRHGEWLSLPHERLTKDLSTAELAVGGTIERRLAPPHQRRPRQHVTRFSMP